MADNVRIQVRVDEAGNPWRDVGFGTDPQGVPNTSVPMTETNSAAILAALNIYVDNETPGGVMNGVNTAFTTFYNYKPGTTKLFLNGVRQREGLGFDYYENGTNQIVMITIPIPSDIMLIDYFKN